MDIINHAVGWCLDLFDIDAGRLERWHSAPNT
jgi:3-polyprenyl-4-hydroxybenzoate decarboxylase